MSRTSLSLAAFIVMAACAATASPNRRADAAATPSPRPVAHPEQVASASVSAPHGAAGRDAVSCDVRARATANGVRIQAVARATRPFNGEYELVITKSGGGGSSDVTQSGPVAVGAGETVTLGSTEVGADGRYRAVLTLRDEASEVCRLERRS